MEHEIVRVEGDRRIVRHASPCATVLEACGETPVRLGHRIRTKGHELVELG